MTVSGDIVERLRQLRVVLKSGEYDGADLMHAWCAMIDAADRIEELEASLGETVRREGVLREALEKCRVFFQHATAQNARAILAEIDAAISTETEGARGCPICNNWSAGVDPALSFCDEHYRRYLATFQIAPKDIADYRAKHIAALSTESPAGVASSAAKLEQEQPLPSPPSSRD